jgi:hypothetical protein
MGRQGGIDGVFQIGWNKLLGPRVKSVGLGKGGLSRSTQDSGGRTVEVIIDACLP